MIDALKLCAEALERRNRSTGINYHDHAGLRAAKEAIKAATGTVLDVNTWEWVKPT